MSDPSQDELLSRLATGDEAAFALLYDRFAEPLFRTAWGLLGSREEAEDAVQDVFVGLVRAGGRLLRIADVQAYLFGAVRHAAFRRRTRIGKHSEPLPETAAEQPREPEQSGSLQRALQALPVEQREVITLKVDGGLTFAEIGELLGVSANTAASRYRYALEKLRSALEGES